MDFYSECISTIFTVFLMVSFPTILSVIGSLLAIIWWLIKFYEKYNGSILDKIKSLKSIFKRSKKG